MNAELLDLQIRSALTNVILATNSVRSDVPDALPKTRLNVGDHVIAKRDAFDGFTKKERVTNGSTYVIDRVIHFIGVRGRSIGYAVCLHGFPPGVIFRPRLFAKKESAAP